MLDKKVEEITWDAGDFKYLCFYHKAFAFMKDSWGVDFSDCKEELIEKEWALFSIAEVRRRVFDDKTFGTALNALATNPQLLMCCDGEYRICQYSLSPWGWICVPTTINKHLWKMLSSECRKAAILGRCLFRYNMIALDDRQFYLAQRLAREVHGVEIRDLEQEKITEEFPCKNR